MTNLPKTRTKPCDVPMAIMDDTAKAVGIPASTRS